MQCCSCVYVYIYIYGIIQILCFHFNLFRVIDIHLLLRMSILTGCLSDLYITPPFPCKVLLGLFHFTIGGPQREVMDV